MDKSENNKLKFINPFGRPWLVEKGCLAAAAPPQGSFLKGCVVGGITGGCEVCFSYPTEFIKTQLQLDDKGGKEKKYKGFVDCVVKTVKERGILGLYRGLSVLIYGSIPKVAIRFGTFEALKKRAVDENGNLPPSMRVLCGLGAGVNEAIFAVTPMETVKVKFIHDQNSPNPKYKGFFSGVKTIIKEEGITGVYKGVVPTVLRQGSNQAIRFYVVESLKNAYRAGDSSVSIPKPMVGVFGIFAGICSVLGNNPIDVVKTRMQGLEAKKYKNFMDCILKIWKHEGPLAFYKGTRARLLRVGIDAGFTFMFYDIIMDVMNMIWK